MGRLPTAVRLPKKTSNSLPYSVQLALVNRFKQPQLWQLHFNQASALTMCFIMNPTVDASEVREGMMLSVSRNSRPPSFVEAGPPSRTAAFVLCTAHAYPRHTLTLTSPSLPPSPALSDSPDKRTVAFRRMGSSNYFSCAISTQSTQQVREVQEACGGLLLHLPPA